MRIILACLLLVSSALLYCAEPRIVITGTGDIDKAFSAEMAAALEASGFGGNKTVRLTLCGKITEQSGRKEMCHIQIYFGSTFTKDSAPLAFGHGAQDTMAAARAEARAEVLKRLPINAKSDLTVPGWTPDQAVAAPPKAAAAPAAPQTANRTASLSIDYKPLGFGLGSNIYALAEKPMSSDMKTSGYVVRQACPAMGVSPKSDDPITSVEAYAEARKKMVRYLTLNGLVGAGKVEPQSAEMKEFSALSQWKSRTGELYEGAWVFYRHNDGDQQTVAVTFNPSTGTIVGITMSGSFANTGNAKSAAKRVLSGLSNNGTFPFGVVQSTPGISLRGTNITADAVVSMCNAIIGEDRKIVVSPTDESQPVSTEMYVVFPQTKRDEKNGGTFSFSFQGVPTIGMDMRAGDARDAEAQQADAALAQTQMQAVLGGAAPAKKGDAGGW